MYDIRELSPDPFPPTFYVDYLNSPKVQEAIGAYVNFSESNSAVSSAFGSTGDDDREDGTIEALRSLISDDVTVVLYAGDADYNCKIDWNSIRGSEADIFQATGLAEKW